MNTVKDLKEYLNQFSNDMIVVRPAIGERYDDYPDGYSNTDDFSEILEIVKIVLDEKPDWTERRMTGDYITPDNYKGEEFRRKRSYQDKRDRTCIHDRDSVLLPEPVAMPTPNTVVDALLVFI